MQRLRLVVVVALGLAVLGCAGGAPELDDTPGVPDDDGPRRRRPRRARHEPPPAPSSEWSVERVDDVLVGAGWSRRRAALCNVGHLRGRTSFECGGRDGGLWARLVVVDPAGRRADRPCPELACSSARVGDAHVEAEVLDEPAAIALRDAILAGRATIADAADDVAALERTFRDAGVGEGFACAPGPLDAIVCSGTGGARRAEARFEIFVRGGDRGDRFLDAQFGYAAAHEASQALTVTVRDDERAEALLEAAVRAP